jgi:hypothetical protein
MALRVFALICLLAVPVSSVTPIEKVIQMLTSMKETGIKEKEDEEVRMTKFSMWCDNTISFKNTAIKKATDALAQLDADIEKSDSDAASAAAAIAGLVKDIATYEADKKEATEVREKAHADFEALHADYSESIDAIERAINVIKAGPQGQVSLMQTSLTAVSQLPKIPSHAKQVITAFLQRDSEPMSALMQDAQEMIAAPEAAAFESSSGGVLQMITDLETKFNDERDDLEKSEAEDRHTYDMLAQELTDQIEAATAERKSQFSTKNKKLSEKSAAEGEHADTSAVKASDEKFLADTTATCTQKKADFAKRQELREGEIAAVQQAIDIMSSDDVAGSGAKHLPTLVQKSTALAQLRSTAMSPAQKAVATFLHNKAKETNSRILSLISLKVSEDPFKKVSKMIKDMIIKLTEEATEEAEHKGFCDTELTTNKQTRDFKTEQSDELKAEIEKLTADIAQYASNIADLAAAIEDLDKAVAEATATRIAEKEKNMATIADAQAGQAAVSKATTILKEFYDKAATATALVQGGQSPMPETFDEAYTGQSSGGVLSMLEVCESDFARLEADTTSGEDAAQTEFDEFTSDAAVDKATKTADMKHKSEMKVKAESALQTAKKDLEGVTSELDAALEYYEKLKPSCVDAGESYEERVARREEEIQSLKEAVKILSA